MTPEKASTAEDLFARAIELPVVERHEFLDRQCGSDAELRAEVESLLRWHELAEAENWDIPSSPGPDAPPVLSQIRVRTLASKRIGPFELKEYLGEGATGVVYRAIDTRTEQTVALKIASLETMMDAAGRSRFERAARASMGLSHVHIARVLATGAWEDLIYVVLEYVEGRTLAEELRAGKLGDHAALSVARQIAEALHAAHCQHLIHRDLKPANIMLDSAGGVKVLDFGLCHAFEGPNSIARTQAGLVMGTLGYMSPEQARGEPPTPRSDLFSLGAVLYEMLAGKPAFQTKTPVAMLSSILHGRPMRPPGVSKWPMELALWCLEREPARRPESSSRVLAEIERIENGVVSSKLRLRGTGLRRHHAFAAAAVVVAACVIGMLLVHRPGALEKVPVVTQITSGENILDTEPAISPDRRWIAFASNREDHELNLWIVPSSGGTPRKLTQSEINARQTDFSPDARTIVYRSDRDGGGIFSVTVDRAPGETPRQLVHAGLRPRFSPDGKWIVYWNGLDTSGDLLAAGASKIFVVPAHGGEPRPICPAFAAAAYPVWSPDGKWIAFTGRRAETDMATWAAMWVMPFAARDRAQGDRCAAVPIGAAHDFPSSNPQKPVRPERWLAGGRLLLRGLSDSEIGLEEVVFSPTVGRILQPVRRLALPVEGVETAAVLDETTVVYSHSNDETNLWTIPLETKAGSAGITRLLQCASKFCIPTLSSDGTVLLYSRYVSKVGWEFVHRNLNNATEKPLDPPAAFSPWPFLAGKGFDSVYSRPTDSDLTRFDTVRVSEKTGGRTVICRECPEFWHIASSGRYALAMSGYNTRTIHLMDIVSGSRTELLKHPQWNLYRASFSPDEASVLFTAKLAPERSQIFVARFHNGQCDSEWTPVTGGAEYNGPAHWSTSGDRIYFTSVADGHRCFYARGWDTRTHRPTGPIRPVYHSHASSPSLGLIPQSLFGFAVSQDKLVFPMTERRGSIWLVH